MNKKEWIEFGKRLQYASKKLDDAIKGKPVQTNFVCYIEQAERGNGMSWYHINGGKINGKDKRIV